MPFGRRRSRKREQRRGVALVEFAMVVPVVFLFIFGIIELSRYVMVQQALTSAAQRGCRKAMLATTVNDAAVDSAVRGYLDGTLGPLAESDSLDVVVTPVDLNAAASGSHVSVQVQVSSADIGWVRSNFLGWTNDFVLTGQSTLIRE
jgi:Flp pilus assembly protein TadG